MFRILISSLGLFFLFSSTGSAETSLAQPPAVSEESAAAADQPQSNAEPLSTEEQDDYLGAEVRILYYPDLTVTEYRLHSLLYMVKIIPRWGAPYYVVDMDGDGVLETSRFALDAGVLVPQWILFRW